MHEDLVFNQLGHIDMQRIAGIGFGVLGKMDDDDDEQEVDTTYLSSQVRLPCPTTAVNRWKWKLCCMSKAGCRILLMRKLLC